MHSAYLGCGDYQVSGQGAALTVHSKLRGGESEQEKGQENTFAKVTRV